MSAANDQPGRLSPLFTWRSAICDSDLPPTVRHVALTLSLHMNERGGSCFPTHDQLKAETGLGRSTVIKALGDLERSEWLIRTPGGGRRRGGNGQATEYVATVPLLDGSEKGTVQQTDNNRPAPGFNSPPAGHQDVIQDAKEDDIQQQGDVMIVYEHWRQARGKTSGHYTKPSAKRIEKIRVRLREFTVADLCRAIDGVSNDPWPDRRLHDDLTIILRSREQVEKFLDLADRPTEPEPQLLDYSRVGS